MENSEQSPSILVVSSNNDVEPSTIVKLILEKEGLPIVNKAVDGIDTYPWHISTKYYETDVSICTLSNKCLLPQNLANEVQAVIVFFDSSKIDALTSVESWQSFLKDYEVDISILLCNRCSESSSNGITKLMAQEWCVKNGYELVELDPDVDKEWEAEQDFIETTGIARVVQALHAHVWPNLTLKERREPTSMSGLLHGGEINSEMEHLRLNPLPADLDEGNIEERLDELLGGSETDFYQLFGELQTMKERVSQLPNDQRKACAEQVVLAFWRAIGGEEEEVDSILDQQATA